MSDRDDTLARLSVMAAEARASLLAYGLDDTSDKDALTVAASHGNRHLRLSVRA